MFTRACGQSRRITQRCLNSLRWESGLESANDVEPRKRAEDFGNLKKVSRVENWTPNEKGWLSLAHGGLGQVSHERVGRWKSQNRKSVPLSPYVEKPLNSTVIKSFVPELRSRYVFFWISRFLCSMIYMNIIWPFHTWPYLLRYNQKASFCYRSISKNHEYVRSTRYRLASQTMFIAPLTNKREVSINIAESVMVVHTLTSPCWLH